MLFRRLRLLRGRTWCERQGKEIAAINENSVPSLPEYRLPPVEFLTVKMHMGSEVNALMIRPPDFDPSRKYPAIVYIAGGPGEQIVRDRWDGDTFLWLRMMAQKGYVIYAQDGHGTAGREQAFEESAAPAVLVAGNGGRTRRRALPAIAALCRCCADGHLGLWRVSGAACDARSAGCVRPGSRAPVADWRLYDAVFSERYLEDPVRNQDGYPNSMPTENAKNLRGPLLIVQGMTDGRVHIENSLELLNEFLETAKYPSVMFVPDHGHVFEDRDGRLALYRAMTDFFGEEPMRRGEYEAVKSSVSRHCRAGLKIVSSTFGTR